MKNNRGEVTIPMVITVIILIILGGICIFMLTGENGIFVPKRDEQNIENTNNIVNTVEDSNVINNESGALTVPVQ